MSSEPEQQYQEWVGKTQTSSDSLTKAPMERLASALDREDVSFSPGDSLPPLWHWLYFLEAARHSDIAEDGHPNRGEFLPPIPLPRRMWAGSRLKFIAPLEVGEQVERISAIKSIKLKLGRSGQLGFVCVSHELKNESGIALQEEHDIVFRDMPVSGAPPPTTKKADEHFDFARTITPDPVLLFRYSALTFNGHRIHYDRAYAKDTESYPGLVVHGPLLATLLIELFGDNYPAARLTDFEFKALKPVFDINDFQCCGMKLDDTGRSKLWIADSDGDLCMEASAKVATE